jgi:hypothetical protein
VRSEQRRKSAKAPSALRVCLKRVPLRRCSRRSRIDSDMLPLPPVRLGPPCRRPILIATKYLLFRGQDTNIQTLLKPTVCLPLLRRCTSQSEPSGSMHHPRIDLIHGSGSHRLTPFQDRHSRHCNGPSGADRILPVRSSGLLASTTHTGHR